MPVIRHRPWYPCRSGSPIGSRKGSPRPKVVKKLPYLLPDGKTQVGIEYSNGKPERIHSITLVASQTAAEAASLEQLRDDLIREVVKPVLKYETYKIDDDTQIFVNPEGPLIGGGPAAHSGLTGRKTGMDTYGEYARHSGTALSGKDPTAYRSDRRLRGPSCGKKCGGGGTGPGV